MAAVLTSRLLAKALAIELFQVFRRDLELIEQLQLRRRIQLRDVGSADFVEDDLEHAADGTSGSRRVKARTRPC